MPDPDTNATSVFGDVLSMRSTRILMQLAFLADQPAHPDGADQLPSSRILSVSSVWADFLLIFSLISKMLITMLAAANVGATFGVQIASCHVGG